MVLGAAGDERHWLFADENARLPRVEKSESDSAEREFLRGWIDVPTGSINGPAVRNKLEQVNRGRKCVVYQNLPSATPESQVAARPAASRLGISRLNQRF